MPGIEVGSKEQKWNIGGGVVRLQERKELKIKE